MASASSFINKYIIFHSSLSAQEKSILRAGLEKVWNGSDDARAVLGAITKPIVLRKGTDGSHSNPVSLRPRDIYIDFEDFDKKKGMSYVDDHGYMRKLTVSHLLVHEIYHVALKKGDAELSYNVGKLDLSGPVVDATNKVLADLGEYQRLSFSATADGWTGAPSFSWSNGKEIDRAFFAKKYGGLKNVDFSKDKTSSNDLMVGNERDNTYRGGNGKDYLWGAGGVDTLSGDDGDDFLFGDTGNDIVNGGNGNDALVTNSGRDDLRGGAGSDTYFVYATGSAIITEGKGKAGEIDKFYFTNLKQSSFANIERSYFVGDGVAKFDVKHDGWFDFQPTSAPDKSLLNKSDGADITLNRINSDLRVALWLTNGKKDVIRVDDKEDLDNVGIHRFETGKDKIDLSKLDWDRLFKTNASYDAFRKGANSLSKDVDVLRYNETIGTMMFEHLVVKATQTSGGTFYSYVRDDFHLLSINKSIGDYILFS